jgi:predicted dithiol-disulfide oxidoreductase (DUF899 family)
MQMTTNQQINGHRVVSSEEWLRESRTLLKKEKELTRLSDELSAERRKLPWTKVTKRYVFDGPDGQETLADLFGQNSHLIVYHFMFGPGWQEGCPSCSLVADHFDGSLAHLSNRNVALAIISRAPYPKIETFKRRMGWRFRWVSSNQNDFNRDFHVSFTQEELARGDCYNFQTTSFPVEEGPGISVFARNAAGEVFHTYSSYGRGCEPLLGVYFFLDRVPSGRHEDGLPFPMAWVRHHDSYAA